MGPARPLSLHPFHSAVVAASTAAGSQSVPVAAYLWIPIAVGAGLVVLLVLVTGLIGVPYVDRKVVPSADPKMQPTMVAQTAGLLSGPFWKARFYASAAWTFSDSWATNITALATALAAIVASGTVLTSIFPNIDLNPFILMNLACGAIVAAGPVLFAITNVVVMRGNPVLPVDASLTLQGEATISLPSGASIALPGGGAVKNAADGSEKARIKPGGTIPVPPGSAITVKPGATMALPSSTAVTINPGATLAISAATEIAASNLAPPQAPRTGGYERILDLRPRADPHVTAGDLVTVTEGAVATVTGVADIVLAGATMMAPGRGGMALKPGTTLTVPAGPNVMAAGMGSVLSAAAFTIFGIGAELGLLAVLAAHYSTAGHAGRVAAVVISAVVAAGLVLYGATGIRSLADPTPGSSLSSGARTSFTL
jgi:hypothetical protein